MDPRLRAAVDASLAWYDDVFALHEIPTQVEDGLWRALAPPPPWHSAVKTIEPGLEVDRVLAVHRHGAVADSFGDLELAPYGFVLRVDATWTHHWPLGGPSSGLPPAWSVVGDVDLLAEWNRAHDYAGVLLPTVLDRAEFTVLALHDGGVLSGGAVVHRGHGSDVVGLSNTWSLPAAQVDHTDVLSVVNALHPGASVTSFGRGADLAAMLRAGYALLGPQRVWVREETQASALDRPGE